MHRDHGHATDRRALAGALGLIVALTAGDGVTARAGALDIRLPPARDPRRTGERARVGARRRLAAFVWTATSGFTALSAHVLVE